MLADEKRSAIVQQQAEVARQKLTLEQVALGHTQMHENIERLQAKDVVQSLLGYRKMREIQRTLAAELAQFR